MGLSFKEKLEYSNEILANLQELESVTVGNCFIPIKQVAYRFNLDNNDLYIEYPYNKYVEKQNEDLDNHPDFKDLDDNIFSYLISRQDESLKYILYSYEYDSEDKPILKKITTSQGEDSIKGKKRLLTNAFRIIHPNATGRGTYLNKVKYIPENNSNTKYKRLLFLVEKFEVDCALTTEEKLSYLNLTLELRESDDITNEKVITIIKHILFDLKKIGETLLNKPLSQEILKHEVKNSIVEHVEANRHTLINLLNPLLSYMNDKTININFLKSSIGILAHSIFNTLQKDDKERKEVAKILPSNIIELTRIITDHSILAYKEKLISMELINNISPLSNFEIKEPLKRFDFITILFNVIDNAQKASAPRNEKRAYSISNDEIDGVFSIIIRNPRELPEKAYKLYNIKSLENFPFDEIYKKNGGVAITKKLAIKNDWNIKAHIKKGVSVIEIQIKN